MLKNKVILVTGSSRGIGAAIARVLARKGATVVMNYHKDSKGAKAVLSEIKKMSRGSSMLKADVSLEKPAALLVRTVIRRYGRIDAVVNNAAIPFEYKAFSDIGWKDFDDHLSVNLKGPFAIIKEAVPSMIGSGKGRIVNIVSSATLGAPPSKPIDYITAKYALLGFSRSLAVELGPMGITVNCVSPGLTDTDLVNHIPQKMKEVVAYQTPLKRLGLPNDVARAVAFLCSDDAAFITGANIPVCGGQVM